MAIAIPQLRPGLTNSEILNDIRSGATMEYNARVPVATQANLESTLRGLQDNRPLYNEFINSLVNRIGLVVLQGSVWSSPLKEFKRGMVRGGDTIQEIMVGMVKARTYDASREYMEKEIFGTEVPNVDVNFHKVNRQEYYKVSINETMLERAFLNEQGGLSEFVAKLMAAPADSDAWDEFLQTASLLSAYEKNDGFHKIHVPDLRDLTSDSADARMATRKLRATAGLMKFKSTKYNAAHMPVSAGHDDLIMITTPEFNAAMDVEALAGAFNIDKAQTHGRIIEIPEEHINIGGAQAILTTKDFFMIADTHMSAAQIQNPAALVNNYFLHHHSIISASRFAPAVLFTSKGGTEVIRVQTPVTGITEVTIADRNGDVPASVVPGELYVVDAEAVTDGTNKAVAWSLSGNEDPHTSVSATGVLIVGPRETSGSLVIKATTVWRDPNNLLKDGYSDTLTVSVSGELVQPLWPSGSAVTGITVKGEDVSLTGTTGTVTAEAPIVPADVVVAGVPEDTVTVNVAGLVVTVTVVTGGADVVYTVTVTDPTP